MTPAQTSLTTTRTFQPCEFLARRARETRITPPRRSPARLTPSAGASAAGLQRIGARRADLREEGLRLPLQLGQRPGASEAMRRRLRITGSVAAVQCACHNNAHTVPAPRRPTERLPTMSHARVPHFHIAITVDIVATHTAWLHINVGRNRRPGIGNTEKTQNKNINTSTPNSGLFRAACRVRPTLLEFEPESSDVAGSWSSSSDIWQNSHYIGRCQAIVCKTRSESYLKSPTSILVCRPR